MKKLITITLILAISVLSKSFANEDNTNNEYFAGINFKKYNSFYWENGIQFKFHNIKNGFSIGTLYETTLLGSAISSNALEQHHFSVFVDKDFNIYRNIIYLNPRLNLGYFLVNYESEIFNYLNDNTLTIAPEVLLRIKLISNFELDLSCGYNIIHGNGQNGLGSLYPIYFRFNFLYLITN